MAMVVVMVIHGLEWGGMILGGVQFWAVGLTENIASPKQIPGTDFVAAQNGWGGVRGCCQSQGCVRFCCWACFWAGTLGGWPGCVLGRCPRGVFMKPVSEGDFGL